MGWFKKKDVPEELPSLAIDRSKISPPEQESQVEEKQEVQAQYKSLPTQRTAVRTLQESSRRKESLSPEDQQGYFRDLIKSVTEGTENLDKIDSWYKEKFLPGDMVFQMREYWEKQQPEILLKNISGELKNKLLGKTDKLHQLEKEWQDIYFHLLAKEEAIRKEEKELKDSLSEFIDLFRRSSRKRTKGK